MQTTRNRKTVCLATMVLTAGVFTASAAAQSSSLFLRRHDRSAAALASPPPPETGSLSRAIAESSFVAVTQPETRQYAVHDLVTIIVRESVSSDVKTELMTEKEFAQEGRIKAIPRLRMQDFLNFQVRQSNFDAGDSPALELDFDNEYDAKASSSQRNTFTARITARIIDVKPNGTVVLEARKKIQTDDDSFTMVLTGTGRREDITVDNTIRSDLIYDMNLVKKHTGELRKSSKKGLLTKLFEVIFNF